MSSEDVLRLLVIREAGGRQSPWLLDPFEDPQQDTQLAQTVRSLTAQKAARREFSSAGRLFRESSQYLPALGGAGLPLESIAGWAQQNASSPVIALDLDVAAQAVGADDLRTLVASDEFDTTWARLANTLLADSIVDRVRTEATDAQLATLKVLMLLRRAAAGTLDVPEHVTLSEWLARTVIVLPSVHRARPEAPSPPPPDPRAPDTDALQRAQALQRARASLLTTLATPEAITVAAGPSPPSRRVEPPARPAPPSPPRRPDGDDDQRREARREPMDAVHRERHKPEAGRMRLTERARTRLSQEVTGALSGLGLELEEVDPFSALELVDHELARVAAEIEPERPQRLLMIGGGMIDLQVVRSALGKFPPQRVVSPVGGCQLTAGVGDLLIVRQDLKAYELSDFAHVENVLAGEFREREHRRLDLTEETRTEETETALEQDRDLQTTQRNEMQSEMERSVQSEFGLEAGLQVSGSYGPTVSFSSSLNVGFSSSSEETQRRAATFSREVSERVAERVRSRSRTQIERRVLSQIEEVNRHRIDNSAPESDHVRGIYRWLTKVYDAQVFNYGQRMMLEFVVPEPAAYFMYAMVENAPRGEELVKPKPPTVNGRPLQPSMLDIVEAQRLIAQYEVMDAPPHPPTATVVSHFDGLDATGTSQDIGRGHKLPIPAGYTCSAARLSGASGGFSLDSFLVMIGGKTYAPIYDGLTEWMTLENTYSGEISVAVYAASTMFYVLGIDLFCTLSADGKRKWQQETYDAIIRTYQSQLAEYEEKLAALEIQEGIKILGRNPLENRRLEREELKKLAIMILTEDNDPSIDAFEEESRREPAPQLDFDDACSMGHRVRFLENSFEWPNMTYVFYPYFWGRRSRWESALHLTDPDPDFAAFLKAGAARVQVPVRLGFEKAVAYFLQTGVIWNGNDPPLVGDELYVPIVDEIAESLNRPQPVQPYPLDSEPWEVRIPTSLVLLQNLEEIPGMVDTLTGTAAQITEPPA